MLSTQWCVSLFERLTARFEEEEQYLNALDAAVGDGDHGTSMLRGFRAAGVSIAGMTPETPAEVFRTAGMAFMSKVGGVAGVIFGQLFISWATGVGEQADIDPVAIRRMFLQADEDIQKRGKVQPGDKSMLDALTATKEALAQGGEIELNDLIGKGSDAAALGRDSTKLMKAAVGRARYQGERAVGHVDAGAASFAMIMSEMKTVADDPRFA